MFLTQPQGGQASTAGSGGPSMLDLVRLSAEPVFPAGGEPLYRQIALLTEMRQRQDVLAAGCGRGTSLSYLVKSVGIEGAGVDPDPNLIREAELRAREAGLVDRLHFQRASLDELPYRDGIFDVAIGELSLAALVDPARAIRELVRVTKPLGSVVLVQLTWTGHVDDVRREVLVRHLGARPMLLVEWKQMLRDAGVVELVTEDWSDRPSPFRPKLRTPFPDFAEIFTFREKLAILRRAMQRWGWRGVRGAILREQEIHRLLTTERVLGLTLIKGVKWPIDDGTPGN
jgi:ubiquinone/menaquinone biosynthesis C-methylase UbiE